MDKFGESSYRSLSIGFKIKKLIMKTVCLFFQIHQPFRHRRYRFFDIGNDHYYYDDFSNDAIMHNIVKKSYLPANNVLIKLAKELGENFKVSFSVTGVALEQFKLYTPEIIDSFQELVKTGCVEFLSETYSHSLASLKDENAFKTQVKKHDDFLFELFGVIPTVFRNTEMIYSDDVGVLVSKMGFKAILTEGAKHILGWKSPNFLYVNAINPKLKVLMRNFRLSDDIAYRFSNTNWAEYPLTADKFIGWLEKENEGDEVINLFLNYDSIGDRQSKETGIFEFIYNLAIQISEHKNLKLATPSEVVEELQPISAVSVPYPISWADEERDLTAWQGNEMQKEALEKLYRLGPQMGKCYDPGLIKDWNYLQSSDHFYYMSTKNFSGGRVQNYRSPFDSPYEAFINYMNVLSDFKIRLDELVPLTGDDIQVESLQKIISNQDKKIKQLEGRILELERSKITKNRKK